MIKVSYNKDKNIFEILNEGKTIDIVIPTLLSGLSKSEGNRQKDIRKLDYRKDATTQSIETLSTGGKQSISGVPAADIDHIISRIYKDDAPFSLSANELQIIKDSIEEIVKGKNPNCISKTSWARSSTISTALKLTHVFQESGLKPHDYTIPGFELVGSFATIADPLRRSVPTIQWPGENIELKFESSFLEFFGFLKGTSWQAKQTNNKMDKDAKYEYSISLVDIFELTGQDTTEDTIKQIPAFKGNPTKNKNINEKLALAQYNVSKISKESMKKITQDIISKEMGDVMQVLVYYVWLIIKGEDIDKSKCSMTTGDQVVYLLCQYLNIPCILWKGEKGEGEEEAIRHITQFFSLDITPEMRCQILLEQSYIAIKANNDALLKTITDLFNKAKEADQAFSHRQIELDSVEAARSQGAKIPIEMHSTRIETVNIPTIVLIEILNPLIDNKC